MKSGMFRWLAEWYLRVALACGFLAAVGDRFGIFGHHGAVNVAWGNWSEFLAYANKLNAWMPRPAQTPAAWAATVAEIILGLLILVPPVTRLAAPASGLLLTVFGASMIHALGFKAPLNYSVFTAAAGAFLLAACYSGANRRGSAKSGDSGASKKS